MTLEKQNDEIDLIKVFISIYKFLKKNILVLLISGIVGGLLGYSTKFFVQKIYTSSMLIESYVLKSNVILEHINNINNIIIDGNYEYLSTLLELDSRQLIHIKANRVDEKNLKTNYVKIEVEAKSNDIYSTLSRRLLDYFSGITYIKDEISIFQKQNKYLINKLDNEILALESQNKEINSPRKSEVNIYNNNKFLTKELISLVKEKQEIQKQLIFASPFRIIQDFVIYKTPKNKTKTYSLSGALSLSFLSLFILLFRKINKIII